MYINEVKKFKKKQTNSGNSNSIIFIIQMCIWSSDWSLTFWIFLNPTITNSLLQKDNQTSEEQNTPYKLMIESVFFKAKHAYLSALSCWIIGISKCAKPVPPPNLRGASLPWFEVHNDRGYKKLIMSQT